MSVTGILIFIVLLLSLELTRTVDNHAVEATRRSAADIVLEQERIKLQLEQLTLELHEGNTWMRMAATNPKGQLDRLIADEVSDVTHLERRIDGLEGVSKEVNKAEQDAADLPERIGEAKSEIAAIKSNIEDLKRQKNMVDKGQATRFEVPEGIRPDEGWICDVTGRGLVLQPFSQPTTSSRFVPISIDGEGDALLSELVRRISTMVPPPRYILFAIRPDGIDFCDTVNYGQLPDGVSMGIELLSEDHVILY